MTTVREQLFFYKLLKCQVTRLYIVKLSSFVEMEFELPDDQKHIRRFTLQSSRWR